MMKWSLDNTFYDGQAEATNAMPIFRYAEILLIYAEAKAESVNSLRIYGIRRLNCCASVPVSMVRNRKRRILICRKLIIQIYTDKYLLEIRRERAIELIAEDRRYDDLMRWKAADLLAANRTK